MRKMHAIALVVFLALWLPVPFSAHAAGSEEELVEMKVKGVTVHPETNSPVVLLEAVEDQRVLPIWIGLSEAQAIALKLENVTTPRPMTHDLLKNVLEKMDIKVVKMVISDLKDDVFYATITLETDHGTLEIDARPSDALALAVRVEAPIYVAGFVLERAVGLKGAFKEARESARARYGLSAQALTKELAEYFGLNAKEGVLVSEIVEEGVAKKAGLRRGDVIIEVDGIRTDDLSGFYNAMASVEGKREFSVSVIRDKNKVPLEFHVP